MKKLLIISILLSLTIVKSVAQDFNAAKRTDTIYLQHIALKKVLALKINSVTILVDYKDFMRSFTPFWKKYRNGVRSLNKGKEKAVDENPYYVQRFNFLDATFKRLTTQIKAADTVYINDQSFKSADIGTAYDFVKKIEEGNCIVLDNNQVQQNIILKQKFAYQRAPLDGWGGRLYFIMGQKMPFITATDWVS